VALDVGARRALDGREADGDDAEHGQQQRVVEAAQDEAERHGVVSPASGSCTLSGSSVNTSWPSGPSTHVGASGGGGSRSSVLLGGGHSGGSTSKYFANTRAAAGAAMSPPKPPCSMIATTTISGASAGA